MQECTPNLTCITLDGKTFSRLELCSSFCSWALASSLAWTNDITDWLKEGWYHIFQCVCVWMCVTTNLVAGANDEVHKFASIRTWYSARRHKIAFRGTPSIMLQSQSHTHGWQFDTNYCVRIDHHWHQNRQLNLCLPLPDYSTVMPVHRVSLSGVCHWVANKFVVPTTQPIIQPIICIYNK